MACFPPAVLSPGRESRACAHNVHFFSYLCDFSAALVPAPQPCLIVVAVSASDAVVVHGFLAAAGFGLGLCWRAAGP